MFFCSSMFQGVENKRSRAKSESAIVQEGGVVHFSDLSPERQHLVRKMREIQFGTIENVCVCSGVPVMGTNTKIVRDLAFNKQAQASEKGEDYLLKPQIESMFDQFHKIRDGTAADIRIQDGLPVRMHIIEEKQ